MSDCPQGESLPCHLQLQWHITQRCNLRCKHCYQESYSNNDLSFAEMMKIVEQFKELLKYYSKLSGKRIRGHITVTGGEPFIRADFFDLLEIFAQNNPYFDFSILTNGTMIDEETAERLSIYGPSFVQISIEGKKETHDQIRGVGSYDKAILGIKNLTKKKIPVLVSFTAHKKNYKEFSDVVKMAEINKVTRVWSDRLIPSGNGLGMQDMLFTAEEVEEFFLIMKKEKQELNKKRFNKTEVAMHRALQFLCGGRGYSCQAGKTLITIDSNGDAYPCRRMPIKIGNIKEESLLKIFTQNKLLGELRNPSNCHTDCKSCEHFNKCQGGLRCLSYAMTGNPFNRDPGCWLKKTNQIEDRMNDAIMPLIHV